MKPCVALSFILASACATPQLAHTVTEVAATASHRVAFNIVAVITHSPAGVHHYTAGAVMPHPVNTVASGSAIAPIAYICLLSLTTVDMTVLGFTVLDVANNPILVITVSGRPRPNTFFSRDWELSVAAGQSYSIFDIVETGPNFAEVEEQACRLRTACKVQQAVVTGAPHTLEQGAQLPPVPYTYAVVPVEAPPSTEMHMLPVLFRPPVCPTDPPWLESPRPSWRPTLCPLVYGDRDPEYENYRSSLNFVKSRSECEQLKKTRRTRKKTASL